MSRLHEIKKQKGTKHFKELYERLDHEGDSKFTKVGYIDMVNKAKKAKK